MCLIAETNYHKVKQYKGVAKPSRLFVASQSTQQLLSLYAYARTGSNCFAGEITNTIDNWFAPE